jgi:drug/metabolite transporter (DMT)-like permease
MPAKERKTLPTAVAMVAAVIFGFSFLFTKNALGTLDIFQLLGARFILAAVLLSALAACRVIKIRLTAAKIKSLLLVAFLQPVLYFTGETIGVKLTSASESGILIALVPIAITICSMVLLGERLTVFKWISVGVCVVGVVLIVLSKGLQGGSSHMLGTAALIGAVVAAGFYNPLSRKASRQSTPMEITFVMMWVGAIVFNAIGLATSAGRGDIGHYLAPFANWNVVADIAYLGILSSIVAFFFFNFALSKMESTVIGTIGNLTPIVSVFAGVFIAGEKLLLLQCVGSVVILAGIWGMARGSSVSAKAPLPVQPE